MQVTYVNQRRPRRVLAEHIVNELEGLEGLEYRGKGGRGENNDIWAERQG